MYPKLVRREELRCRVVRNCNCSPRIGDSDIHLPDDPDLYDCQMCEMLLQIHYSLISSSMIVGRQIFDRSSEKTTPATSFEGKAGLERQILQ